jgi:hypothetical protein
VESAGRQANAHDFVTSFPEGYDTLVGERGVRLGIYGLHLSSRDRLLVVRLKTFWWTEAANRNCTSALRQAKDFIT